MLFCMHTGPTPYDVPVQDFVNGLYHLRVEAEDEFGNIDSQELTFSPPPPTATFVGCESLIAIFYRSEDYTDSLLRWLM